MKPPPPLPGLKPPPPTQCDQPDVWSLVVDFLLKSGQIEQNRSSLDKANLVNKIPKKEFVDREPNFKMFLKATEILVRKLLLLVQMNLVTTSMMIQMMR